MKTTKYIVRISALLCAALMSSCQATNTDDLDEDGELEAEAAGDDAVPSSAEARPLPSREKAAGEAAADPCDGACAAAKAGEDAADGDDCVPPWDPTWQQGGYANEWWVEFAISGGSVKSAYLEVIGKGQVALTYYYSAWVGGATFHVPTGSQAIVHATDTMGRTAQTLPFAYLVNTQPETDPCKGTGSPSGCTDLAKGMVTITMDDGLVGQHTLARPLLLAHGIPATIYLPTAPITDGWTGYLTLPQAQALAADGNEIGSHTVTHPDLTQLSDAQILQELSQSKQWLEANLGVPVKQLAVPYGAVNENVTALSKAYYDSLRTVNPGLNYRGDDPYALKGETIFSITPPSHITQMLEEARTTRGWYIALFHNFSAGVPGDQYSYSAADFGTVLDAVAASGLDVVTVGQGIERLRCPPVPPANDTCPGEKLTLSIGTSATVSGTLENATDDYQTFCADVSPEPTAADVVYELDVPAPATVTLECNASGFVPAMSLRKQQCTTEVGGDMCLQLGTTDLTTKVALEAGTYWIVIDTRYGSSGTFSLAATYATPMCGDGVVNAGEQCDPLVPTAGDGCIDPGTANGCHFGEAPPDPTIVACPGGALTVEKGAALQLGPYHNGSGNRAEENVPLAGSDCEYAAIGPENVFHVTPAEDGTLTAQIGHDADGTTLYCDTHFDCADFVLYLRTNRCDSTDAGDELSCADFTPNPLSPFGFDELLTVTAPVTAGSDYWLVVDGLDDTYGIGEYYLQISLQ